MKLAPNHHRVGAPSQVPSLPVSNPQLVPMIRQIDYRCLSGDNLAHIMFAEITTDHLALRDLEVSDAERIFEYRSHPDVSRFQSWGTQSADAIQLYIRDLSESEPGRPGS